MPVVHFPKPICMKIIRKNEIVYNVAAKLKLLFAKIFTDSQVPVFPQVQKIEIFKKELENVS